MPIRPSPSPRRHRAAVALLVATLPGCMTAISQKAYFEESADWLCDPSTVIYGGTRAHARMIGGGIEHDALFGDWLLPLFVLVDLPLSLVADTVLLPITVLERATMHVPDPL